MSTISERTVGVRFTGDINQNDVYSCTNTLSPGQVDVITVQPSPGTIVTYYPLSGFTPVGLTIIPPVGNTLGIGLKGSTNLDAVGVKIHPTHPTSLAVDTNVSPAQIVLYAASTLAGVRIIWT